MISSAQMLVASPEIARGKATESAEGGPSTALIAIVIVAVLLACGSVVLCAFMRQRRACRSAAAEEVRPIQVQIRMGMDKE